MKRCRRILHLGGVLFGLLLGTSGVTTQAEIAAQKRGDRAVTMIRDNLTIIDDFDPVPQVGWAPIGSIYGRQIINASGNTRPDGRPDVAFHPNSWPVVVWAYNNGPDHDIALAEWNGTDWKPVEWVTSSVENEIDPRVFLRPSGDMEIVYWIDGEDPRVMLTKKNQLTAFWTEPVRISEVGELAKRPTVASFQGSTYVAYERDGDDDGATIRELVIRSNANSAGFPITFSDGISRVGELHVLLHVRHDAQVMWIDLAATDTAFAYSRFLTSTSNWDTTHSRPWPDDSWVGIETARKVIERLMVTTAPDVTATDPDPIDPGN